MRIAIGIVSLFPGGGLQRDCLQVVSLIQAAGHEVVIFAARLTGAIGEAGAPIILLPNSEITNHRRQQRFAADFLNHTVDKFDLIVGFDKLAGLDVLYCGDQSMRYRVRKRPYLGLLERYRAFCRIEADSFRRRQETQILLLSQKQRIEYVTVWGTERNRMIELPPTVSFARCRPQYRVNGVRERLRKELQLAPNAWVWLAIGVQPKTKGLDRVLRALQHSPNATLVVAGLNGDDRASQQSANMARRLGVFSRTIWLGHREDIESITAASDILMHPARYDTTGTVILEALINGLPVITTSACGYAKHVQAAGGGIVLEEPFDFRLFLTVISDMNDEARRAVYSERGITYGANNDLYGGREVAARIIVDLALRKQRGRVVDDRYFLPKRTMAASEKVVWLSGR